MLPAINLGSVLASVDTQMSENRVRHRTCVLERRMHRNMEGFCIYQAYLRRLRSLHRAYVNKYKQMATKQAQAHTSSQPHRYQQRQQQQQQRQRQQQQLKWSFMSDRAPVRQCSHLKCCHDEERRRHAGFIHPGNKFYPEGVHAPSEECLLHEPIQSKLTGKLELVYTRFRHSRKISKTPESRRFGISHTEEDHRSVSSPKSFEPVGTSLSCESSCYCDQRYNPSPRLPPLPNKATSLDDRPYILQKEDIQHVSEAANSPVKSDPAAIRIPCGRDGSFFETEEIPTQVNLVSLKLETSTSLTKPLERLEREALPFRAWKRRHEKLGGAFYSTDLNSLHHT